MRNIRKKYKTSKRILIRNKYVTRFCVLFLAILMLSYESTFVSLAQSISENTPKWTDEEQENIESNKEEDLIEIQNDTDVEVKEQIEENAISTDSEAEEKLNVETDNSNYNDENSIFLGYTSLELELGEIDTAYPGIEGSHPDDYWKNIQWISSDESVAVFVKSDGYGGGYVKAISAGNCTITAYLASKPEVKATCEVKVYDPVSNISLDRTEIELQKDASMQLNTMISPTTARQDVIWRTTDSRVAEVDENGVVHATSEQNAMCQIFAFSSVRRCLAACTVKVVVDDIPTADIQDGYIVKPVKEGNLLWSIDENGHLEISGTGNSNDNSFGGAWLEYKDYIKSAQVMASGMDSVSYWFWGCKYLTNIDVSNLDTSNVLDMSGMFCDCTSLTTIKGIDKFRTLNVTNMACMFENCLNIETLDLSNFNTDKVQEIHGIFKGCSRLKKLNLSGWTLKFDGRISYLNNYMFDSCFNLADLNFSESKMICGKEETGKWTIENFLAIDSDKVQTYTGPAEYLDSRYFCPIKNINLSEAVFENYNEISFAEDLWLESINLDNVKVVGLNSMWNMFYKCNKLEKITLVGFDTSNVTNMWGMFYGCSNLKKLDISRFDTSQVTSMGSMFAECSSLQELKLENFDTKNVSDMEEMFYGCKSLRSLDISNFTIQDNVGYGIGTESMLDECTGLETIVLPSCSYTIKGYANSDKKYAVYRNVFIFPESDGYYWKNESGYKCVCAGEGGKFTRAKCNHNEMVMYGGVDGLSNWTVDFNGVMELNGNGAYNEKDYYPSFRSEYYHGKYDRDEDVKKVISNLSGLTSMNSMFELMNNLEEVNLSNTDTSQVTTFYEIFYWCKSLKVVNLNGINTQNATNMGGMFRGCEELNNLDVSGFDTSNVTNMSGMFAGCKKLGNIDVRKFNTSNVTNMDGMFQGCEKLSSIDVSGFDTKNVTSISGMFAGCKGLESLSVGNFDTSNVTNMNGMFQGCEKLTSLDISNFDMKNLTNKFEIIGMLDYCTNLTKVIAPANAVCIQLPKTAGYSWTCKVDAEHTITCESVLSGNAKSLTYIKVPNASLAGSVTKGTQITDPTSNSKYTVTSTDPKNPTVSYDGSTDPNAKSVTIPEYITYNGVQYKVTTVSTKSFQETKSSGQYTVTDNQVGNLTVEYTAPANKNKKTITIPEYVTYHGVKYKVTSVSAKSFKGNKKLTTIKIASSITQIGDSAFEGCTSLKTVTIGTGLKTIGKNAFKNCKKLKTLTIKSSKLKTVGKNAFKGIYANCKIKVPAKKVKAYTKLMKKKGQKSTVKITK